jgi:mannosyltransferase OCH1-like enzyme
MAIPKVLHQTYVSYRKLPLLTRYLMKRMRRFCPGYAFEFYEDERIETFLAEEYGAQLLKTYKKIAIGAAKADFFRYALLLKKGGVYLDVDSLVTRNLDELTRPDDEAIISHEGNPGIYVQWALIFAPGHPFLAATLDRVVANIETNRFPYDVHKMTGPTAYSEAIDECLAKNGNAIRYRDFGVDYEGFFRYKQPFSGLLYRKRPNWRETQKERGVLL